MRASILLSLLLPLLLSWRSAGAAELPGYGRGAGRAEPLVLSCEAKSGALRFTIHEGVPEAGAATLRFGGELSSRASFSWRSVPDRSVLDSRVTRLYEHPFYKIELTGFGILYPEPIPPGRYEGSLLESRGSSTALSCEVIHNQTEKRRNT